MGDSILYHEYICRKISFRIDCSFAVYAVNPCSRTSTRRNATQKVVEASIRVEVSLDGLLLPSGRVGAAELLDDIAAESRLNVREATIGLTLFIHAISRTRKVNHDRSLSDLAYLDPPLLTGWRNRQDRETQIETVLSGNSVATLRRFPLLRILSLILLVTV